jgi:hypothetical protein
MTFLMILLSFLTDCIAQLMSWKSDAVVMHLFCRAHIYKQIGDGVGHKVNLLHLLANGKMLSVSASFSTSNFVGPANSYGNQMQEQNLEPSSVTAQCQPQTLPSRPKTQRPRVPPPSKVSGKHATLKCLYISSFHIQN